MGGRPRDTLESIQQNLDLRGREITVFGIYVNQKSRLDCSCKLCGYVWTTTSASLRSASGRGCVYCSRGLIRSLGHLQSQLDSLNKNFTLVDKAANYHYIVRCDTCQRQWTAPSNNLIASGCAGCSRKVRGGLENTQNKLNAKGSAILVSGSYIRAYSKLDCLCQTCGVEWSAHSHNLLNNNRGCPSCARTGYDPNKPGFLYYLKVEDSDKTYWKVGITNLGVSRRFNPVDLEKITIVFERLFEDGKVAQICERNILKLFSECRGDDLRVLKTGNTELFTRDVLQMGHLLTGKKHDSN